MVKNTKNQEKAKASKVINDNEVSTSTKVASIVILLVMVSSIAGFAFLSGGSSFDSNSNGELPDNLPLTQYSQEGQVFNVAIKNKEQFIFRDISGFEENLKAKSVANFLNSATELQIYYDNLTSQNAQYLIEKYLNAARIPFSVSQDKTCVEDTLIITESNKTFEGECESYLINDGLEQRQIENILYFNLK